jgi:hypothetical protein
MIPSSLGGATTENCGYFEYEAHGLAAWIVEGFSPGWRSRPLAAGSMQEVVDLLAPAPVRDRFVCVPVGHWTALLTSGPAGSDVGVLPIYAVRELACRAIRVASVSDSATFPVRMLEVYGPDGTPPLWIERSIVAAKDGARWTFEISGTPYAFEDQAVYANRVKAKRFTEEMLLGYLRALGVPIDGGPDWQQAILVERSP